jgi:hypothetical protein
LFFLPSGLITVGVEKEITVDGIEIGTVCCCAGESLPNSGRNFLLSSSRFSRIVLTIFSSSSSCF